jgi:hypothetical protein
MASHSRIFIDVTRTSYLLLIQVQLFPLFLKKVLSVCLSLNNIGTHPKALITSHQFLTHTHTQMAMIIKEAEFLKREGLSSQILLHAVLLLLFLFAHTFQQDLKSCQSYGERIFESAKKQRFVHLPGLQAAAEEMCKLGVSLNSQETENTLVANINMPFIKCSISVF